MLSTPTTQIQNHYEVLIIGSGYGASYAAEQLSTKCKSIALFEKGKEYEKGDFPETTKGILKAVTLTNKGHRFGRKNNLVQSIQSKDIDVVTGCGLGGGSLINAAVAMKPSFEIFQNGWPSAIAEESQMAKSDLTDSFSKVLNRFSPSTSRYDKQANFFKEKLNSTSCTLNINFDSSSENPCNACGNCVSGCNVGAKKSLDKSLLKVAKDNGVEIFTEVEVKGIKRVGERWVVYYDLLNRGRTLFESKHLFVTADQVIFGAGAIGTTTILQQSVEKYGLKLSNQLGKKFGSNGDSISLIHCESAKKLDFVAPKNLSDKTYSGPCITEYVRGATGDCIIENGIIPSSVSSLIFPLTLFLSLFAKSENFGSFKDRLFYFFKSLWHIVSFSQRKGLKNCLTLLGIGIEDPKGEISISKKGQPIIKWNGIKESEYRQNLRKSMIEVSNLFDAKYVQMNKPITVHPLGGCPMGENFEDGVVNHKGQVFNGVSSGSVYEGLYIFDGSVVPTALGVNPFVTISALAYRNINLLIREKYFNQVNRLQKNKVLSTSGFGFSERMSGYFSKREGLPFNIGYKIGEKEGRTVNLVLSVFIDDIEKLVGDQNNYRAGLEGTVEAPCLSSKPLTISNGSFELFTDSNEEEGVKNMKYSFDITSEEGITYNVKCFKVIKKGLVFNLWKETTTAYFEIDGAVKGTGIVKVGVVDFMLRQLLTMKSIGHKTFAEGLKVYVAFLKFFVSNVLLQYGGFLLRQDKEDKEFSLSLGKRLVPKTNIEYDKI